MPKYDFECQTCRATFELQKTFPEYAAMMKEKTVGCPKCGSKKIARVFNPPGILSASSAPRGGGCCCPGGKCG